MPTPQELLEALKQVKYPGFSRDIVAFGMVKDILIGGASVVVQLAPSTANPEILTQIRQDVIEVLKAQLSVPIQIEFQRPAPVTTPPRAPQPELPWVQYIIAVASGKGGVGKSTVSTNLAAALSAIGQRVGLLDADVYGPSIALMLGIHERPQVTDDKKLVPISQYGLKVMSTGFLVPDGQAVVWRGPMLDKLLTEFIHNVEWGELDTLIVDLPPGTGDAQLTMVQKTPLSGGVVVTTPQDVALLDVRRGVKMFTEAQVPVLGVIENMSYHLCRRCGHRAEIFKHGGGARMAEQFQLPFLGEIPIVQDIRVDGDRGTPLVIADPGHPQSLAFVQIARQIVMRLEERARRSLGTIH
jgi:ATP-binding protein involved in chromosome partitioning